MKNSFLFILLFIFCFFTVNAVSAQISGSIDGLDLSISSNNPVPGQDLNIIARSYVLDINTARITWSIDGKTVQTGLGKTTYTIKAPSLGKKTRVIVTATSQDGISVQGNIVIGSGYIDLVTETDGYVPPFFKGKTFPIFQNELKIIAIPHLADSKGNEYDPKTLNYQWKRNNQALESQSGYGKQSITLTGSLIPRPYDISVTAWPREASSQAEGFIQIVESEPSISFYKVDPLYGTLFNKTIGNLVNIGSQKETTVVAVPYGFNKKSDTEDGITWLWQINGNIRPELNFKESIVIRAPENSIGNTDIKLEIQNTDRILQGAQSSFSARFNTTNTKNQENSVTF